MNIIFSTFVMLMGLTLSLTAGDKIITTSVYYEVICPDSRYFVINELADNYLNVGLVDKIHLELIRFGKTTLNEAPNDYVCQFDGIWDADTPCRANTLHLCIIDRYFDGKSDDSKLRALKLINCLFTPDYWRTHYSVLAIEECHQQLHGTPAQPLFDCYHTRKRELLDSAAQKPRN